MYNQKFIITALIFILTISVCGLSENINIENNETTIENGLNEIIEERGIPGITLSITVSGKTTTYSSGFADIETQTPMNKTHRMLLGSTGKSIFAALALKLESEGVINLNDKAENYLGHETWFTKIANHENITIRSLLNHTSGVPEYVYTRELWQTIKDQPNKKWTAKDRMSLISDMPSRFNVGEGWSYADANYIILGALIEQVTKKDIYILAKEELLQPHHMVSTDPSTQQRLENLSSGYSGNFFGTLFGEKIATLGLYNLNPQFEWTGGGFITTSEDLSKWIYQLYNNKILTKSNTKAMFHSAINRVTAKEDRFGYSLGTEVFETRYGTAYGHTGFMPGYSTFMAHFPDYDTSIAFQINIDPYSKQLKKSASVFELIDEILPLILKTNKVHKKTTTLYFVRHAEKANDGTRNPGLTNEGKSRSELISKIMGSKNINAVYSTAYKRTTETAQPLAKLIGKNVNFYDPTNTTSILDIIAKNEGQNIVIVGHSNTIPAMLNFLEKSSNYQVIPEAEYDNLFKVMYSSNKTIVSENKY
ncbi:serine hydrolase [uncultured Psychroserpens sp.]|uniref:serine hydrolase n=1 Tax=uncultured Psychroserpens sp. TaxID=255436 RepID=UPI00261F634F|nr:serine hydrolase [uncultured Psychroserpens sp.]